LPSAAAALPQETGMFPLAWAGAVPEGRAAQVVQAGRSRPAGVDPAARSVLAAASSVQEARRTRVRLPALQPSGIAPQVLRNAYTTTRRAGYCLKTALATTLVPGPRATASRPRTSCVWRVPTQLMGHRSTRLCRSSAPASRNRITASSAVMRRSHPTVATRCRAPNQPVARQTFSAGAPSSSCFSQAGGRAALEASTSAGAKQDRVDHRHDPALRRPELHPVKDRPVR
jgi:hypothetical protein